MWQFNQSTGQWEWIENPNKKLQSQEYSNLKQGIQQELNPSSGIEEGVKETARRRIFEEVNPDLKYEDFYGTTIGRDDLKASTAPQVLTGKAAEQYKLYSEKYGQSPYIGADIEDLFGESQSTADKWANGTMKFVGKTATNVIGGLAMFPGLAYGAATGSFKNIYDNDFQRALDEANESMDEALPNYLRKEVEDYDLLQKMVTANFWANDALSGMSFVAGAVLTEMASAGLATPLALSRATRALKALGKGSKVADATKLIGKVKGLKVADNVLGVGRKMVTGTFYEAGVESRHFANEAKEQYINNYIEENGYEPSEQEMAEAMGKIYNVANGVFALNSALVGMSNVVTLPKTFGPKTGSVLGKLFNPNKADEIGKGLIKTGNLSKRELRRASKRMGKTVGEVKKLDFVEKALTKTRLERIGGKLYKLGEKPFTEGVWEEMMQGSVNKGALDYVSKYLDEDNKLELFDLVSSLGEGMAETYGSQEGWEEGVIGMIIGGAGFVGPSSKGKGLGWQGGIWDSLRDPLKTKRAEYLERANNMATPDRIKALVNHAAVAYKANKEYNEAAQVGDMFTAKSAEHEAFFSDVNFRMKLGDYQTVEDNINDTIDGMTDTEFADMFDYENITEKEIQDRKSELKASLLSRATTIKDSINEARVLANTDNEYIQDALAYSLATVQDIDKREEDLSKLVSTIMGTVDSRSVKDVMKANNRLQFKQAWLGEYNRKLSRLDSAKKRLVTMQLSGVANQERINKQQQKIDQMQKDISSLEEQEFNARKTNALEAPEYLRDFDSFRDTILKLSELAEKVEKHYFDKPADRRNLNIALRDLEKLSQRRETFIGEINRLITKEGREEFIESLDKLEELQRKGYTEPEFEMARITGMVDPNIDNLILEDIQKKAYESVGLRLRNAGIAITDSSNLQEAIEEAYDIPDGDGISVDEKLFGELKSDTAKTWIEEFNNNLPPSFEPTDSVAVKIAKTKSKQNYVKQKLAELEKLIKDTIGTEINNDYQAIFDSGQLQDIIAQLDKIIAQLEAVSTAIPTGVAVIENASKFGQIYIDTKFVPQADIDEVEALSQEELYRGIYIVVEDYPDGSKLVDAAGNPAVKVQKGIVGMSGKGAVAYININGREVKIGGVLDPRRFVMSDGKNFDAYNLQHLYELNSSFVNIITNPDGSQEAEASTEGVDVQTYFLTLLELFKELETNNGASTDLINRLFYTNKNFPYKVLKDVPLEERPSISVVPDEGYGITYTYETVVAGKKEQKQNTSQLIIRRSSGDDFKAYAKKDGKWTLLEGNEAIAVTQIYQELLASNSNYEGITGQYVMMVNKPTQSSKYSFLSIGFPSAENKKITTTDERKTLFNRLVDLIKTRQEEIESSEKTTDKGNKIHPSDRGVTFRDENNNDFFLSLLTNTANPDATFALSKSITAEIQISKFGYVSLALDVVGIKDKQYVDLYLSVNEQGTLMARFGKTSSPVNSYDKLIEIINGKIKLEAERGKTFLLDKGQPIRIGGFFSRVDKVSEDSVVENMGEMRLNVSLTPSIVLRPKNLKEKTETSPENTQGTPQNEQQEIYNKLLTLIISSTPEQLKSDKVVQELKKVIQDSPIPDNKKRDLNTLLDSKVKEAKAATSSTPSSTPPPPAAPAGGTDARADIERRRQEEINDPIKKFKAAKTKDDLIKAGQDWIGVNPYDNADTPMNVRSALLTEGGFERGKELFIEFFSKADEIRQKQINAEYDAKLAASESTPTATSTPASTMTDEDNLKRIKEIDEQLNDKSLTRTEKAKLNQELAQLVKNLPNSDPEEISFSISPTEAVEKINMQTAESNLARMLNMRTPQNPNGVFSMQDVRNILTNVKNNGITWGAFFNNVVYLSEKAGVGTEYHEAFHAVFRTLLSPTQINAYYVAARKQYGNPTNQDLLNLKNSSSSFAKLTRKELENLWLEEQMAEGFKSYAVKKDSEKPKGLIGILFDKIKKLLGIIKDNQSDLDLLFQDIYSGKFKNSQPFNSLVKFREPAFSLIKRKKAFIDGQVQQGYFNSAQSERIINTIASRALSLEKEKGRITESDIYNLISDMATNYYNIDNFDAELTALEDAGQLKRVDKIEQSILNVSQSLQEAENIKSIAEEVSKRLSLFNLRTTEEEELEDYFDNEVGERNFDQNIAEIGGFGTLSSRMRQFIAFTTEGVDEFGFGEFADLSQEKFRMSSNAFRIYTGVERVLANTPIKDMLPKLKAFAENNSSAYAFYNHLTSSINTELHSLGFLNFDSRNNTDISILSRSSLFSNFATSFQKNKVPQVVVIYDNKSKKLKAYRSNVKDDSAVQVDEWARSFINSGLEDKEPQTKGILNDIERIFNDETKVTGIEDLTNAINDIQKLFLSLGISLSKGYIKHSIVSKYLTFINGAIATGEDSIKPYYLDLMSEYILFQDTPGFTSEDVTEIRRSIAQSPSNNPFVKKLDTEPDSEQEDTAAIGRFKKMAASNTVFDETVASVTFQNSEGKSIYTYIQPSYLTSETEKWKKRAKSAANLIQAIREERTDEEGAKIILDMMAAEGTPYEYYLAKNMYQTIKNNPYLLGLQNSVDESGVETSNISTNTDENYDFSVELLNNLASYIIDGMRVASLEEVDVDGEQQLFEQTFKGSSGTSYGSLDGKGKLIQALAFFANSPGNTLRKKFRLPGAVSKDGKVNRNKERASAPIVVGVNEAKNTQNAVHLPVQKFSDSNGQLTKLGVEYIYNAFLQEYNRIGNVQKEIGFILNNNKQDEQGQSVYDIEGYHYVIDKKTGKRDYTKGKGHDFFQFKQLMKLDPALYVQVLQYAKQGKRIPNAEEIKGLIKNQYAPSLFDKYVKRISNSRNRLITPVEVETKTENGVQVSISSQFYTKSTAPNNRDTGFIFTENAEMLGTDKNVSTTQALIRTDSKGNKNPNALPIITKKGQKAGDFWQDTDEDFNEFVRLNTEAIQSILDSKYKKLVFPSAFATDKAKLPPRFSKWLQTELEKNFNLKTELVNQETGLKSIDFGKSEQQVTYKNRLLPEYYENSDGSVDMAALSDFFFNDLINSMTYNMLVNGDYAMLFKDPTDVVKRNSRLIAAGPSLGTGVSRVAIVKSILAKDRYDKNTVKDKKIEGLDEQDTTDAQNLGTLNWYINKYLMSSGKLPKEVARIYEKMEKGYRANLGEVKTLKHFNALINPRKIVGVNRYFYDKTSIKTLLRSETSYMLPENRKEADELYDRIFEARRQGNLILQRELYQRLHSLWGPIDSARANHDLLNKLELDNIDILIFDSAIKTMKANVGTVEGNNEIGFTWNLDPIQVDDESFKEQVKTDSIKSKVVDPTQLLNTVFSEQKLDTKANVLGKQTTLKDVVDSFEKLVAERSKRGFEEMRKSIISGNLPRYKYLLSMFKDNLMQTGADPYLIEMVSESLSVSGKPEFNLNMPSTIDKLESMFLSYISKNTLKVKAPGHKLTLISDFGSGVMEMNGKIVTDYEFQENPKKYAGKVSTRRLEFRKKDKNGNLYTEIKISAQFAEHLGLKPGDNIPSELLEMFGVRIPTQDKHSMGYFKVVDFLPMETGNQIMLPYEILKLSGADFDVDAEYLRTFDFFSLNDKPHWFGQYLKAKKLEDSIEQARQEYIRENSQSKDVKKERDLRLQNSTPYQLLRQMLSQTKEELKKKVSKGRLDAYEDTLQEINDIIESYFNGDEVSEDNSIPNSVTALPQYSEKQNNKDATFLAATLKQIAIQEQVTLTPEEIKELKGSIRRINKTLRDIETEIGIKSLEQFGYPASEEKFKAQFGKTVINNRTAYEEGNFSSINPITIAEINNLLIPLTGSLIYNNSNEEIGNTTTSTKDFDALEERLGAQGIVDETILEGIHDATSKNAAAVSNDTGKENIGPAAVFNLMFQRLHKHKVKFSKEFLKKKPGFNEFIEDLSDGFELTLGPKGEILNKQGVRVNDLIDQIISAMTDNGKDPKAARFNLSYETLGSVLLRIGMGEPFNLAVLTQKQPALVDVVSALQSNKSDLEENKYPKSIIFASEIKKYFNKIKITVNGEDSVNPEFIIDFNEDALIEALKYSQDPNSSRLTEGQYNYIQGFSLQRMAASVEISDYLRNLSDLIGLARGLKPTFAENYNIRNSLEKLGLAVVQKKGTKGDKIEDFEIERDPNAKIENLPMDVLPMIKGDKILSTNIKIFTLMLEDSGKFFVLETKTGREIMDMASISFKDNFLNYKENASSMRKALLAFLSMRAYRKIKGINNPDINSLFKEDLVNLHSRLLQKAEFKNNALLRALIADKIPFGEKNRSNLKGLTLHKLAFNSRTKNNPDYVERLIDDFKLLATSPDPEAKHFAAEAFMYLMMKDAGLFKSDTFIRQIAPIFLKNVSVGLDKVQDLFSNGKGSFTEVFGIPKEKLVHEFVELFARYAPNNFYLKGNKLDVILKVNSSKEAIAEIRRLESLEEATSEDVKAVVKEEAPVFYDGIKQTLTFNLKKGVKKGATAEEIKRIMGINKSILGTTGLFDEKGGKIIYPPFIQVTMEDGQGGATKRLFKLDILHTGNEIRLDENGNVITDSTYSRNTSDNNLFASEMTGGAATYIPVNPYLEKSIAPWFWTTEELEAFRVLREAEQSNDIDAEIASAEEATTEEQNNILAAIAKLKQSFNPLISPAVTPAASDVSSFFPTSSQPSTSPKQEESSVSADELLGGMAGIRKKLQQKGLSEEAKNRIKNIGKNLKPGTIGESKSSSKQPINQAALTNILDKLSNKFGISWKYDTSIPGLGQFKDGVVLINPNKAKLDTPFHEFAHPFIAIIKIQNPLLYKNLVSQISKTEIGRNTFDKVKKLYPELTYEQQLEETIVDLIGQYAADQQSLKQEKGLWNAIKTFLRRVSEYLKSLLSNENKKVIPSELDPNTTMEELSSMLVIDNPIDLGTMLGKGYKKPSIKPGVQELFDSNPELANQVYESLGFNNLIKPTDKIIWGHPAIGKSYAAKKVKMIDFDSYKLGINRKYNLYIAPGLSDTELRTDDKTREARENWRYEKPENAELWNQFIRDAWQQAKKDAKEQGAILFASDLLVLREFGNEVDKALTMPDELFFERSKQRNNFIEGELGTKVWKNNLNKAVANFKEKFGEDKVISTNKYLSDLFITPEQKQQAIQLYSQYLDTIFPDSQVKDIVYHDGGQGAIKEEGFKKDFIGISDGGVLGDGFYFYADRNKRYDKWRSHTESVILNIKNLSTKKEIIEKAGLSNKKDLGVYEEALSILSNIPHDSNRKNLFHGKYIGNYSEQLNKINIDGLTGPRGGNIEYVVFEPEQIHILGSKQDIEGFKEFVNNPIQRVNLDKPTTLFNIFANVADSDVIELINNCN
jgi:hypothetical protein